MTETISPTWKLKKTKTINICFLEFLKYIEYKVSLEIVQSKLQKIFTGLIVLIVYNRLNGMWANIGGWEELQNSLQKYRKNLAHYIICGVIFVNIFNMVCAF